MSTYCTRSDIEDLFGVDNVEKWADLDNKAITADISARITRSITEASDDIDETMLGGPYAIPIVTALGATPTGITNIAATLAGVWLYTNRGIQDFNQITGQAMHKLAYNEDAARSKMAEYRASVRRLSAVRVGSMVPHAVDSYEEVADDDDLTSGTR